MAPPAASLPRLFLLAHVVAVAVAASGDTTTAAGQFRVNCGASVWAADSEGRVWDGDDASRFAPFVSGVAAGAPREDPSLPSAVPYMTARVFDSSYTYSFLVRPGRVFLRLYFYPAAYAGRGAGDALFGVAAGGVTLLRGFNASQAALALEVAYLVREFSLYVSAGSLDVTFAPSSSGHGHAYLVPAINAVGGRGPCLKAPPHVLWARGSARPPRALLPDAALQTMYRLNVGGTPVSPGDDSDLLYRSWDDDAPYIFGAAFGVSYVKDSNVGIQYSASVPPYVAPASVYASARSMGPAAQFNLNYNLTWLLPVDAGFRYLLRLHFCEIRYPIRRLNQRSFYVYVNNQTAQEGMDVIALSGGIGRPVYADYVVAVTAGQTDLWVALHPDVNTLPQYYDAFLNGLEVFKLQTYDRLAAPSPQVPDPEAGGSSNAAQARSKRNVAAWAAAAGGLVAVLVG
ncbi:hypothetical protein BS78_06G206500 [Paspalum vaginatum]|nr:hypothetical protein BS78_06G206500 [Paspalum vaginatum]